MPQFPSVLIEEADDDSEIPGRAGGDASMHEVLRLRLAVRFALHQTPLRMTELWGGT